MLNFKVAKGAPGKELYGKPNRHLDFWDLPTDPKYRRESNVDQASSSTT